MSEEQYGLFNNPEYNDLDWTYCPHCKRWIDIDECDGIGADEDNVFCAICGNEIDGGGRPEDYVKGGAE